MLQYQKERVPEKQARVKNLTDNLEWACNDLERSLHLIEALERGLEILEAEGV